ncbi:MAG TPA: Hsp20/alpha crystallin family protein [Candidatus Bipolaricaulota bacterium]
MNKKDKRAPQGEDSFEDALADLGRSMSRVLKKAVEKSEEILEQSGLEDLFSQMPFPEQPGAKKGTRTHKTAPREPVVDVFDEGDALIVYVELPGASEESIKVSVQGKVLHVKAQAGKELFEKDINLPSSPAAQPVHHYKNGILKVELKKKSKAAAGKSND